MVDEKLKSESFENLNTRKGDIFMEVVKTLEEKIAQVIEKVKELKEEKNMLQQKVAQLEDIIRSKEREIELLNSEKALVKGQIEELLRILDSVELR